MVGRGVKWGGHWHKTSKTDKVWTRTMGNEQEKTRTLETFRRKGTLGPPHYRSWGPDTSLKGHSVVQTSGWVWAVFPGRVAGSTPRWRHFGTLGWLFWAESTEQVWRSGGIWAGGRLGHEYISAGWCWGSHQAGNISKESRPDVQLRSWGYMGSQTSLPGSLPGENSSQVHLPLPLWEEENRNPGFHMKSLLLKIWTQNSFFKWWEIYI